MQYLVYGDTEKDYLRQKDAKLGAVIDAIGDIKREVIADLHIALIRQIISQQISTRGALTVWQRLCEKLPELSPAAIVAIPIEEIQSCGMSMRKAQYIKDFSQSVFDGRLDLDALYQLEDAEVCAQLSTIKGIGVWTAEMLMTFSMQRPNVISYGDLAIQRGLRMLYRHRKITPQLFEKYRRRYAPYATVASLYLWEIANGACAELSDPAPAKKPPAKAKAGKHQPGCEK